MIWNYIGNDEKSMGSFSERCWDFGGKWRQMRRGVCLPCREVSSSRKKVMWDLVITLEAVATC